MNQNELKLATQKQLKETREAMLKPAYLLAVSRLSAEDKRQSAINLSNTHAAYINLRAKKLAEVREQLEKNEIDLKEGIVSLKTSLANLTNAKAIISASSKMLNIVARIVALL